MVLHHKLEYGANPHLTMGFDSGKAFGALWGLELFIFINKNNADGFLSKKKSFVHNHNAVVVRGLPDTC
jgi:hypothetical protein